LTQSKTIRNLRHNPMICPFSCTFISAKLRVQSAPSIQYYVAKSVQTTFFWQITSARVSSLGHQLNQCRKSGWCNYNNKLPYFWQLVLTVSEIRLCHQSKWKEQLIYY